MVFLVHLIAWLAAYKLPLLLLPLVAVFYFQKYPASSSRRVIIALFVFVLVNLAGGPFLRNWLIYQIGEPAAGQVVSTYRPTGQNYRGSVVAYKVMLRAASGQVVESQFRSDSLVSYPNPLVRSPLGDDVFDARYLPGFPQDMVLVTNNNSGWMVRERCSGLMAPLQEARTRFNFAGGAAPYRQPYIAAIDAYLQQGCVSDERRRDYLDLRKRAAAGQLLQAP